MLVCHCIDPCLTASFLLLLLLLLLLQQVCVTDGLSSSAVDHYTSTVLAPEAQLLNSDEKVGDVGRLPNSGDYHMSQTVACCMTDVDKSECAVTLGCMWLPRIPLSPSSDMQLFVSAYIYCAVCQ